MLSRLCQCSSATGIACALAHSHCQWQTRGNTNRSSQKLVEVKFNVLIGGPKSWMPARPAGWHATVARAGTALTALTLPHWHEAHSYVCIDVYVDAMYSCMRACRECPASSAVQHARHTYDHTHTHTHTHAAR